MQSHGDLWVLENRRLAMAKIWCKQVKVDVK